ncbi:MAG TPA: hypothetical protein VK550_33085 [Polyangiaceae bacterium]|nr:hypothetical protein [Polyangiaceae bacterium]
MPQRRLRSFHWRRIPFALVLCAAIAFVAARPPLGMGRTEAVVRAFAAEGLDTAGVVWVDKPPTGIMNAVTTSARALVRAAAPGEQHDIYLARARLTPEGALLGIVGTWNLTRTASADESAPILDGELAVYTATIDGVPTSIFAIDLSHEQASGDDLGRVARTQVALTNLQDTGQLAGITRRGWTFDPSPSKVAAQLSPGVIEVVADGRQILLPREGQDALVGGDFVRAHRTARARPGNVVTWAVDRVRNLSWFGDARMQSLKAATFGVSDALVRFEKSFMGDTSAKDIASDLGGIAKGKAVTYTDPETGWPPPPMKPMITPALTNEGVWGLLDGDPFILTNPGAPAAFATGFVRTDRERLYTRVYVTVWDPRQVEMHMMAGTVEPVGASGETGPGIIPRTPEIMGRVVAGLNGGFQALHGEFGMMGDGIMYLPPKPYAATVAALRDGSTAFGEWPADDTVPDFILSYRQNLTVLVKDEKFNPYRRTWWGGTPPGQTDKVHTTRSGICLTREDFVAYFYGAELSAEALAQGMIQARCKFGIHLDMNVGHTGLEFYRAAPAAELAPLGRPVQTDWEAEGTVTGLPGWNFRGRRMIRYMPLMNFPRFIHREQRDFFYLTLRHVLPGNDPPGSVEGQHWRTRGLPQHGFPYALATTKVALEAARPELVAKVLKIDPRVVAVQGASGVDDAAPAVVVFSGIARAKNDHPTLWLSHGAFSIAEEPPDGGTGLFSGLSAVERTTSSAAAAVGITDDDGMLLYIESDAPDAGGALDRLLGNLGCSSKMLLAHSLGPALGGTTSLDGTPVAPADTASVRLVRHAAPGAKSIFEDTPVVPPEVWQPLQMRRIRYFKKPAPTSAPSTSGSPASPLGAPGPASPVRQSEKGVAE